MRSVYQPRPEEQMPRAERNLLRLGMHDGELLSESSEVGAHVKLCASPHAKGWLALIRGMHANWSLDRSFCQGKWVGEEGGDERRCLEFTLQPGLYEAECELGPPSVDFSGVYKIYLSYQPQRGIVLLDRAQFEAGTRLLCDVSFGDVRALIAQQKWSEAARAARFIRDDTQREGAAEYVTQHQERWEQALPALEGRLKQVTWASSLRQSALTAFRDYGAQFSKGDGPAREELERAQQWLLAQNAARFWIDHREKLSGPQLWELYLKGQIEE